MNRRFAILLRTLALAFAIACAALPMPRLWASQIVAPTGVPISLDVSKGLIIRLDRPCSSVFVADPDIADVQLKSPTVLYVMGKGAGSTTIYAVDAQDAVLLNSRVEVHQDIDRLQRDIRQLDPGGHVQVKAVDDSIILDGTIKDAAQGEDIRKVAARYVANPSQIVNRLMLDTPNQITLQVRVAEVDRNVLKQFGINWQNLSETAGAAFGVVSAATVLQSIQGQVAGGKVIPPIAGANPNGIGFNTQSATLLGNQANNNLFGSFNVGSTQINALVDALAQNGLITILAEPNLTTVSGKKASFLAGGEFPIPVPQSAVIGGGGAMITIEWKSFGVSLNFTPTMLGNGRIALHVAPEVSQLAPDQGIKIDNVEIPGITTRRAETTVELGSGQTFAIAGLLQSQTHQQLQAYPWISDIPVIGALFRSTAFQRGETELVIMATPFVVQPVSTATALTSANDGFYAPSDRDRVLNGSLNTVPSRDPATGKPTASAAPATANVDGATPAPRKRVAASVTLPAPAGTPPNSGEADAAPATITTTAPPPAPAPKAAAPGRAAASGFEID